MALKFIMRNKIVMIYIIRASHFVSPSTRTIALGLKPSANCSSLGADKMTCPNYTFDNYLIGQVILICQPKDKHFGNGFEIYHVQ